MTRNVTDTVLRPDGTPWEDAEVTFYLKPGAYSAEATYPSGGVTVTTDVDGMYSAPLWPNAEGLEASKYLVIYPGKISREFVLPEGDTDISIRTLWESAALPGGAWSESTLATLMDTYRSEFDTNLHAALNAQPHSGTYTNTELATFLSGPRFHLQAYGAVPNTNTLAAHNANEAAVAAAVTAAVAAGGGVVWFGQSDYYLKRSLAIEDVDNITFAGDIGATIYYPSADTSITAAAPRTSNSKARSGILLDTCNNITVQGLTFIGNSTEDTININIGTGVYATACTNLRIINCNQLYGGGLLQQEDQPTDIGLRMIGCYSYGARTNVNPGTDAVISACYFELPTDVDYDRIGNDGSSHAIYIFGGRHNITIQGCVFKNIRESGVKCSASSEPIRQITVSGCIFIHCGSGVLFGADDVNEHSGLVCNNNQFYNCCMDRAGWSDGAAVTVLGSRSVEVHSNLFGYSVDTVNSGKSAISVSRYRSGPTLSSPVEMVSIKDNVIEALLVPTAWSALTAYTIGDLVQGTGVHYACIQDGTSAASQGVWSTDSGATITDGTVVWRCRTEVGATNPSLVLTTAISVKDVGEDVVEFGALRITGNMIRNVGGTGILAQNCIAPVIEGNTFSNVVTAVSLTGNRMPLFGPTNVLIAGPHTSANAQIRMSANSWPIIHLAPSAGRLNGTVAGQSWSIGNNNAGASAVDFPLLGIRGRSRPAEGRPEVVMAYGDNWVQGDTVQLYESTSTLIATFTFIVRASEVDKITLTDETGGTFTISVDVAGGGVQTTLPIAYDAPAVTVDTMLEALSNVGAGNVAVTGNAGGPYTLTFGGALAETEGIVVTVDDTLLTPGAATATVEVVTAGSHLDANEFEDMDGLITLIDDLANYRATEYGESFSSEVDTRHIRIRTISTSVTASAFHIKTTTTHPCAGVLLSNATANDFRRCYSRGEDKNEVQTVTISGSPTGGTFTLTYSGQTTAGIAFDAAASAVRTALEALSNIGVGDVTVTGSAATAYTVTFTGTLGATDVDQMTASGAGLTGGSSPAVTVATTTEGADSSRTVIWSPLALWTASPAMTADNKAAATHLATKAPYVPTRVSTDTGSCLVVEVGTVSASAEEVFRWNLH